MLIVATRDDLQDVRKQVEGERTLRRTNLREVESAARTRLREIAQTVQG